MKHKRLSRSACPIARSLDRVGEWWSILILREAFYGAKKFDEFQQGVEGIAPNMLTRRLKALVDAGLFDRRRYHDRPARYEYVLTQAGRDFHPVMWAMMEWGNKHCSPEGDIVQLKNFKTGKKAIPGVLDKNTGREMSPSDYRIVAGPAATAAVRKKIADSNQVLE